jgi:hypothetical protein
MYNFADSTVTASAFTAGANTGLTLVASTAGLTTTAALVIYYDDQLASSTVTVSSLPTISGTVTANVGNITSLVGGGYSALTDLLANETIAVRELPAISGTVTANVPLSVDGYTATTGIRVIGAGSDGSLRIQGINPSSFTAENLEEGGGIPIFSVNNTALPVSGTVTLGAGTAQIGSVTASISGTVTVSGTFFQTTQPVSLVTLPTLAAGTAQIGSVTASISNSVVTFYPMQGTTVSNTNFTSTTASTSLVSAVAGREVLTVFNEGAGNLHISPGATATTISYQVRLSAGDYWECPQGQLSLAHTAVFATAGTARVTQVS